MEMAPEDGFWVPKWYLLTSACGRKLYTFIMSMARAFSQPFSSSLSLWKTKGSTALTAFQGKHLRTASPTEDFTGQLIELSFEELPNSSLNVLLLLCAGPGRAGL